MHAMQCNASHLIYLREGSREYNVIVLLLHPLDSQSDISHIDIDHHHHHYHYYCHHHYHHYLITIIIIFTILQHHPNYLSITNDLMMGEIIVLYTYLAISSMNSEKPTQCKNRIYHLLLYRYYMYSTVVTHSSGILKSKLTNIMNYIK